jgi:hypothetical protein
MANSDIRSALLAAIDQPRLVGELIMEVGRVTQAPPGLVVAAVWDLVESGQARYGTDAKLSKER